MPKTSRNFIALIFNHLRENPGFFAFFNGMAEGPLVPARRLPCFYPIGIVSASPGLSRRRDYPGQPWTFFPNPNGVQLGAQPPSGFVPIGNPETRLSHPTIRQLVFYRACGRRCHSIAMFTEGTVGYTTMPEGARPRAQQRENAKEP
jgi:hypothetical protein